MWSQEKLRQAVAFHAFKQVNQWYNCWLLSNHHGFWGVDELVGQCGDYPYTPYEQKHMLSETKYDTLWWTNILPWKMAQSK